MKPAKPYADYPLTAHPCGQWVKKIRGKLYYFGTDATAALAKYLEQKDYLHAGQAPPQTATTVADILNAFIDDRQAARDESSITERTYAEYGAVCDIISAVVGDHRPVDAIAPDCLLKLRSVLGKGKRGQPVSPQTHKRLLSIARMVFNFGNEELGTNVRYRRPLKQPAARLIRQHRNEKPRQLFEAEELRALVKAAKPQMKAMILLGINCGFHNADVGTLPIEVLDLENGFHDYWRPKTQNQRRCPLWPETQKALAKVVGDRTEGLVFRTKYGKPWWVEGKSDPIAQEFRKLAQAVGVYREGVTKFSSLRHTFRTVADSGRFQQHVIKFIGGWVDDANDMASFYRERIYDEQLLEVTKYVRKWYRGKVAVA